MRIVAGEWRGRPLVAPKGESTRPTSDRVREALFSAVAARLGPDLGGVAALDPFAGTGALGLEALSRGAATATFVEQDRAALAALARNIDACGAARRVRVVTGDCFALARRGAVPGGPFGLLLLDAPYRIDAARITALIGDLTCKNLLAEGALAVWEHASGTPVDWPEGFTGVASKRYGTTSVDIATLERAAG